MFVVYGAAPSSAINTMLATERLQRVQLADRVRRMADLATVARTAALLVRQQVASARSEAVAARWEYSAQLQCIIEADRNNRREHINSEAQSREREVSITSALHLLSMKG